jgi:hypothetical protein
MPASGNHPSAVRVTRVQLREPEHRIGWDRQLMAQPAKSSAAARRIEVNLSTITCRLGVQCWPARRPTGPRTRCHKVDASSFAAVTK